MGQGVPLRARTRSGARGPPQGPHSQWGLIIRVMVGTHRQGEDSASCARLTYFQDTMTTTHTCHTGVALWHAWQALWHARLALPGVEHGWSASQPLI